MQSSSSPEAKQAASFFARPASAVMPAGEQLREGLEGATKDTFSLTKDSVEGTGSAAGDGLGESMSDLAGDDRVRAWDRAIPKRYQATMQQAREALQKMPYPPAFD
jgi:hypothetical protein